MDSNKISLDFLHNLAHDLAFELDDKQCQNLALEFTAIANQMALVTKINTNKIEPLDYPFDLTNTYLRADIATQSLPVTDVLAVAPSVKGDYITINRVVGVNDEN